MIGIVHIHKNLNSKFRMHPDWRDTYYYIEMQVRETTTQQQFQLSRFVQLTPNGLCFMQDRLSNSNATIHLLTPVKNQYSWVKYQLEMLEDVIKRTKETKVHSFFNYFYLVIFKTQTI